jgi:hypothetical protein
MIKVPPLPVIIKTKGEGGATKTMFFIKITKEGHSYKQGDEKTIIPFDFTIVSKVLVTKS